LLFFLVLFSGTVFSASPSIQILDPNGWEAITNDTNYGIDFNVSDADSDELLCSIYYTPQSSGAGSYGYAIVKDWNVTNTQYCPNYSGDSSTEYTCIWDWNLSKRFVDVSDEDLVVYFPMDYNVNSEGYLTDYSQNDYNGTVVGADFNTSDCVDGNCFHFEDADNDAIQTNNLSISWEEGTLMGWFNPDDWTSTEAFMGWKSTSNEYDGINLIIAGGDVYGQLYENGGGASPVCNLTSDVSGFSGWHHITMTWKNGGQCHLYVDTILGESSSTITANMSFSNPHRIRIGDDGIFSPNYKYDGLADEVKVYKRQLTLSEIEADYNRISVRDGEYFIDANCMDGWVGTEVTDSSDKFFSIGGVELIVKKPLDEATGEEIYAYSIAITGEAGTQDYNNLIVDQNAMILNDVNYTIRIDTNDTTYYGRTFYISVPDGTDSYELQPYLVKVADAIETTIHTIDSSTLLAVSGIKIETYKVINSVDRLISSFLSDSKGEALGYFLLGHTYTLYVYDSDGALLLSGDYTQTTTTDLYIYIDETSPYFVSGYRHYVDANFSPTSRVFTDVNAILTQTIYSSGTDFNRVHIFVTRGDANVFDANALRDVNYSLTATIYIHSIDFNSLSGDANAFTVTLHIYTNDGNVWIRSHYYYFRGEETWITIARTGVREELGCSPDSSVCVGSIILSLLLSMVFTASVIFKVESFRTVSSSIILFMVFIALFTFLNWIPLALAGLMGIAGFFMMVSQWRHD